MTVEPAEVVSGSEKTWSESSPSARLPTCSERWAEEVAEGLAPGLPAQQDVAVGLPMATQADHGGVVREGLTQVGLAAQVQLLAPVVHDARQVERTLGYGAGAHGLRQIQ